MTKILIVLSALAVALGQEYELLNNLVDFEESPYQSISLPYPYQDNRENRVVNIQSKPISNAIMLNNGVEEIRRRTNPAESGEFMTSLSNINTSLISKICAVAVKFLGGLKIAMKLLLLNIPAFLLGAILVIGFCKVTSVCTKISSIQSLAEAKRELGLFVTPERLEVVSEFVQEAIRRYRSIQTE